MTRIALVLIFIFLVVCGALFLGTISAAFYDYAMAPAEPTSTACDLDGGMKMRINGVCTLVSAGFVPARYVNEDPPNIIWSDDFTTAWVITGPYSMQKISCSSGVTPSFRVIDNALNVSCAVNQP